MSCYLLSANYFLKCFLNSQERPSWTSPYVTVAVRERRDVIGFGPWTMKAAVLHVQPPAEVMSGILAVRLHLDESALDNGPLRVIAGSHGDGRLSAEDIARWERGNCVTCVVPKRGNMQNHSLTSSLTRRFLKSM